jgi:hypothetical protein
MGRLAQLVGYLGWLVGCYYALLVVLKLWKRSRTNLSQNCTNFASGFKRLKRKEKNSRLGGARWGALCFACCCCAGLTYGAYRIPKITVVHENHVAIIEQLDNGDFAFKSDEEPNGDTFRPCLDDVKSGVDTVAILTQGVGYIADYAVWEERGTCKSIVRKECGFWFKDVHNNFQYRRIANAGTAK